MSNRPSDSYAPVRQIDLDPNRFVAMGASAGGHLVLMLGVSPNHPRFGGRMPSPMKYKPWSISMVWRTSIWTKMQQNNCPANALCHDCDGSPNRCSWLSTGQCAGIADERALSTTSMAMRHRFLHCMVSMMHGTTGAGHRLTKRSMKRLRTSFVRCRAQGTTSMLAFKTAVFNGCKHLQRRRLGVVKTKRCMQRLMGFHNASEQLPS